MHLLGGTPVSVWANLEISEETVPLRRLDKIFKFFEKICLISKSHNMGQSSLYMKIKLISKNFLYNKILNLHRVLISIEPFLRHSKSLIFFCISYLKKSRYFWQQLSKAKKKFEKFWGDRVDMQSIIKLLFGAGVIG